LPRSTFATNTDHQLPVLQSEWPEVQRQREALAAGWTDASVCADLTCQDLRGNTWTHPLWKLIMHDVNHATHHRGHVAEFLRSLGRVPPALDLIAYYRL
jgi:uncharacterized damage-inducible protein DinB